MDLNTIESIRERLNLSHLGKPAVAGIVVILLLVAVSASRMFLGTATANEFEVSKSAEPSAQETADSQTSQPASIFVHISGEVSNPGLCELQEGARVADAVNAAGGFTDSAAVDSVNLARPLTDGEQVIVMSEEARASGVQTPEQQGGSSSTGASMPSNGLVNINTASAAELKTLPGIGEVTAQKILDDRTANGRYLTTDDLKRVSGIGDKTYEKLAHLICV